jgi:hypothetical protein
VGNGPWLNFCCHPCWGGELGACFAVWPLSSLGQSGKVELKIAEVFFLLCLVSKRPLLNQ